MGFLCIKDCFHVQGTFTRLKPSDRVLHVNMGSNGLFQPTYETFNIEAII